MTGRSKIRAEGDEAYRISRNSVCPYTDYRAAEWQAGWHDAEARFAEIERQMYGPIGDLIDELDIGDSLKHVLRRIAEAVRG